MGRRPRGRDVQGILLLDKPLGVTSNKALQRVKQIFFARKAGHTGSLDPEAGGLLPICFGGATKVSAYLLDADKRYWVRVRLGETTTTADAEGELLRTRPVEGVTEALLGDALARFRGEIQQIPPMYSALKHQGERLYKLAREGVEVERKPRTITIYELKLLAWESPHLELEVRCSKGTYIRTLAEDIGEVLGCGAHVAALRRTGLGPYREADMVTMERIEAAAREGNEALDALLLGVDSALGHWPQVRLTADSAFYLGQGQAVLVPNAPTGGPVRIYDPNGRFLGIGEILDDGRVAPRRMI
ncbi:MAG: tRNA pseudouridine(55) synthase TruB [Candidatus Sedimenticola endophacoides]|uniref:tRNA pseudouridine synthase B n=2 Tax=Candidatus Sedimenticola endophacoides TaxID=2548426 RepID=A0A6N4DY91_9GAMM|nr:MAG: tRNA pseudouridine(55) synthase TruB [Candidatus Sedimenticola endophacoides]OQX35426.1 MAG: tRNA pseudouridine(55) synthase TruB [Candidatus Sedimenticola endophacoides]OQX40880.1 MAG: tRNA pseudouridine(55) synthase TruB [Candidatus Sedimenticola endophacoides]OQX43935.1 MAG: tRNA pseudouridine(55) synthase TruB [Candidatus Sedimenticola endophacoides]OQX44033.1 MAG: tRNA pseudouridine(55) synthase TruB [Candidatus Sedimenticola endophacoides]